MMTVPASSFMKDIVLKGGLGSSFVLREIYDALEGIARPGHEESLNLHAMIRQAQIRAVGKVPQKSHSNKKAA
ncbi:MAG: hypothetical protein ACREXO_04830 [Advenella sp.]